jgi:hypothetical protein
MLENARNVEYLKLKVKILQFFYLYTTTRFEAANPSLIRISMKIWFRTPDRNTAYRYCPTRSIYLKGMPFDLSLSPNMLNENKGFRRMCR